MELKGKRVLVTGGAGFIGSNLSEYLLAQGCEVTILDNFSVGKKENLKGFEKDIRVIKADIRDLRSP